MRRFGLSGPHRCQRIGDYCAPEIKGVIELLPGNDDNNWEILQQLELKRTYWPHDKQRKTSASLNQFLKNAPNLDLNVFMLKYSATSSTLNSKGALSPLDRIGRLLHGLSVELRRKVLKFCAKKSWRLSAHDTGINDPVFDELKEFILTEAQAAQKETVYSNERASRENSASITTHSDPQIDIPAQTSAPTSGINFNASICGPYYGTHQAIFEPCLAHSGQHAPLSTSEHSLHSRTWPNSPSF
jgi:hypothetical protein